jgi:hypothetical protein
MNIKKELARVNEVIRNTDSPYLKRDYEKYKKRLEREMKYGKTNRSVQKGRG